MPIDAIKQPAWSKERQREYNREYRAKHAEELAAKAKLAYAEKKIRLGIRDVRGPVPKVRTPEELAAKRAAKAEYDREYRAKNAEKIRAEKAAWGKSEVKKAYDKRWAEENREKSREIKRAWKQRNPTADNDYRAANLDAFRAYRSAYYVANNERLRAKSAEWLARNPERAKATQRAHYAENRHVYIARARSRRTHLEQATPAWIDMSAVAKIYKQAAEQGMHVDHIIPLKGKTVCGLHVETNLQLLTPKENLSKGNRYAD